jgi:hypothetical protein
MLGAHKKNPVKNDRVFPLPRGPQLSWGLDRGEWDDDVHVEHAL